MTAKYQNLGFQTLEMVETAPISLLNDIISSVNSETGPQLEVEWSAGIDDDALRLAVLKQLNSHRVEELRPLEDLCQRIRALAAGKGPTSLSQVVLRRRSNEEFEQFQAQPDELCRSAWVFLHYPADFEDSEAFYTARQYRDFGKMYDSFEIDADSAVPLDSAAIDHQALVSLLTARLQLPSQVIVRTLDLPKTSNHPASIMVIVRHGGPLSSVFNHKDNGMRGTIYFRPPNEATLIWTPSNNVMEICGPTPQVRKQIGDTFAEVALKADLSKKPLNWRRYDLARFNSSFALTLPVWDDVEIIAAKLIEVELRLGTWSRRLSLRVTIDDDIQTIAERYLGDGQFLRSSAGFGRLAIAIHYSKVGYSKPRSMEISFGDTRSNLQSKSDPEQRDLGYRLLQFWGILDKLQVLDASEITSHLPALLQLHDLPEDEVSGAQLHQMGVDPKRLRQAGLLDLCGRQNIVLIDDDEDYGDVEVGALVETGFASLTGPSGENVGAVPVEDIRRYTIKRDWLEELLLPVFKSLVGSSSREQLDPNLSYFGRWRQNGIELPIYFARRLYQPKTLQQLDVILRGRQDGGIGIVLTAGPSAYTHLGPNVLMPLVDFLHDGQSSDDAKAKMFGRFQSGRLLAMGGGEVAFIKFGSMSAMLCIPGKPALSVSGFKQMIIIERLVAAHLSGSFEMPTGALVEGSQVKSPADAWPSANRKTVAGVYFENSRQGFWRLKTEATAAEI